MFISVLFRNCLIRSTVANRSAVLVRSTNARSIFLIGNQSNIDNTSLSSDKFLFKQQIEDLQIIDRKYIHSLAKPNLASKMSGSLKFTYPQVERDETNIEKIFDQDVANPYGYLEDPQASKTKEFVKNQIAVTEPFLNLCPHRAKIKDLLSKGQNYERTGCTFKRGDKYYYFKNTGLQPQSILYQQDSIDGDARIFFDPNKLSEDGTVALSSTSFSPNGHFMIFALSYSGSDWLEIGVKNVTTGENLKEKLTRVKFSSLEWTHDNKGFFYAQYPTHQGEQQGTNTEKQEYQKIYYHVLDTPQTEDVLKIEFTEHPKWLLDVEVSHDGKYLNVLPRDGCNNNQWYYCRLDEFGPTDKLSLKPIYARFDAKFDYISNDNETFYFLTDLEAANFRIVKLDLNNPSKENWVDVIPNHPEDVLNWVESYTVHGKKYLLVNYLRRVVHYLELHEIGNGIVKKFKTSLGTISKYSGRQNDGELFFQFTSFLTPGQVFHFDLSKLDEPPRLLRQSQPSGFNPDDYTIEQVFYKSKDGTEIPMFIVHRKDLIKDGQNPCILYGYGGFSIQMTSAFNINRIAWLKNFKGILAVANLRGGGEFGKPWHDGGRCLKKQNVFDDFIAAGEYLINQKYTNTKRLAIEGASNGGLLVGAVSNQRPDLFGASIAHVGVMDMIRFKHFTIGHAWMTDFGDPEEREHFENLIKYSPYHNIPDNVVRYPATLLLTADHDDRVVPAHSFKFIAQLQHKLGKKLDDTPLIIRIDTKAGHGAGRPVSKVIDEYADIYSFLYNVMNLQDHFNEL